MQTPCRFQQTVTCTDVPLVDSLCHIQLKEIAQAEVRAAGNSLAIASGKETIH